MVLYKFLVPDRNAMARWSGSPDAASRPAVRARTHVRGVAGQAGSEERRAAGVQVVNVDYRNDRYTGSSYGLDNVGRRCAAHIATHTTPSRASSWRSLRARRRTAPQSGQNSCIGLPSIRLHEEACGSIQAPVDRYLPPQGMP